MIRRINLIFYLRLRETGRIKLLRKKYVCLSRKYFFNEDY